MPSTDRLIVCTECGKKKIHYGRNLCGTCYNRWWRKENAEYYKKREAEYRAKNKERFKEYQHKWYLDNRERLLEKRQQYDQEHQGICMDCGAEISRYGLRCCSCATITQWQDPQQREKLSNAIRKWNGLCIRCGTKPIHAKELCHSCYSSLRDSIGGLWGLPLNDRICFYCGKAAEQWDHFVPVSAGGKAHAGNMLPACRDCNMDKFTKLPQDYLGQLTLLEGV